MYIVYLIQNSTDYTLYIGSTKDLKKRLEEHNSRQSKYTKKHKGQWTLIYFEVYRIKKDALIREKRLKSHGSAKYQLMERVKNSLLDPRTEEG